MPLTVRQGQTLSEAIWSRTQEKQSGNMSGALRVFLVDESGRGAGWDSSLFLFVLLVLRRRVMILEWWLRATDLISGCRSSGTEFTTGDMSFATVGFLSLLSLTSLSSPVSLSLSRPPTLLWHRSAFSYSRSTLAPCRRRVPSDTGGGTGSWARHECRGTQGAGGCPETEGQSEARIA